MNDTTNEFNGTPEEEAQLTAFVLGELSELDAAAVARRVEADPALGREIDAIRATADEMAKALGAETGPALTDAQRDAIAAGAATPRSVGPSDGRHRNGILFSFLNTRTVWAGAGLAAAACLAIAFLWPAMLQSRSQGPVALRSPADGRAAQTAAPGKDAALAAEIDRAFADAQTGPAAMRAAPGSNAEVKEMPAGTTRGVRQDVAAPAAPPRAVLGEEALSSASGVARDDAVEREGRLGGDLGALMASPGERRKFGKKRRAPGAFGGNELAGRTMGSGAAAPDTQADGRMNFPWMQTKGVEDDADASGAVVDVELARSAGSQAGLWSKDDNWSGDPAGAAMAEATAAFRAGDYDAARSKIQAGLEQAPEDLSLLNGMVRVEVASGRAEEAQKYVDRALSIEPGSRTFLTHKANLDDPNRVAALVVERPDEPGRFNRDAFARLVDNEFKRPTEEPQSTFSIDVDTASYAQVRRFIEGGTLPPKDAVRIEELINYFDYDYEPATGDHPFSVTTDVGPCPWNEQNRLVRIGLRGRDVERDMRPATNLVFLIDVSGSMDRPNKLPLVKASIRLLVESLTNDDRVAMAEYAGAPGLVLPSTFCDDREAIVAALDRLQAGGSTAGGAGIELAYRVAEESFIEGGVNRVILCTDGDFNVGVQSEGDLTRLIEAKRESGVFLSVLGFGTGNFQDDRMEKISNAGNGNFAYIDGLEEARKVLVEDMAGTLVTIAKDVKIQVEFNPAKVGAYRLIGYANRLMDAQDFRDDTKDAGEIGAGHTVTALYEIAPAGVELDAAETPDLRFQEPPKLSDEAQTDQLLEIKLRYKQPDGDTGTELSHVVHDDESAAPVTPEDLDFAAAVAGFGMILRDSADRGNVDYDMVLRLAGAEMKPDANEREVARDLAERFAEQVQRERLDLAGVFAQSLTSVELTDTALAATIDADQAVRVRLDAALAACPRGKNADARIDRLRVRLAQGRMTLGDDRASASLRHRAEFIDLVERARELSER